MVQIQPLEHLFLSDMLTAEKKQNDVFICGTMAYWMFTAVYIAFLKKKNRTDFFAFISIVIDIFNDS